MYYLVTLSWHIHQFCIVGNGVEWTVLLLGMFPSHYINTRNNSVLPPLKKKNSFQYSSCCCCLIAKFDPTLCDPMDCSLPGSSVHGISQARNWSGLTFPSLGSLPNPGIESRSLALPGRFFLPISHLRSPPRYLCKHIPTSINIDIKAFC